MGALSNGWQLGGYASIRDVVPAVGLPRTARIRRAMPADDGVEMLRVVCEVDLPRGVESEGLGGWEEPHQCADNIRLAS